MYQRRRPRISVGSGVLIRLLALNTGRGRCRARIFCVHRTQDGTAWARC